MLGFAPFVNCHISFITRFSSIAATTRFIRFLTRATIIAHFRDIYYIYILRFQEHVSEALGTKMFHESIVSQFPEET